MLIVCYLRPKNLELLLQNLEMQDRKLYVFIDKSGNNNFQKNEDVFNIARKFQITMDISILWSDKNIGVARAVPFAIEWISSFEEEFIILEDDCIPRSGALPWFDRNIDALNDSVVMISGFSPCKKSTGQGSTIGIQIKYPMIWGWATSKGAWQKIMPRTFTFRNLLRMYLKPERNLKSKLSLSYFIAAQIRVQKGKMMAWDAPVALNMLISNRKALVSPECLIDNVGTDEFASHPQLKYLKNRISDHPESVSNSSQLENLIEETIYQMKPRNILAPVRAFICG